jgi:hypothetical protein
MSYERKRRPQLDCLDGMSMPLPTPSPNGVKGCVIGTVRRRLHKVPEDQTTEKCRTRKHMWYVKTHQYVPRERPEPIYDPVEIEAAIEKCRREKFLLRACGKEER